MEIKMNHAIVAGLSLATLAAFGQLKEAPKKFDLEQIMLEKNCALILKELIRPTLSPQEIEHTPLDIQIDIDVCSEIWRRDRRKFMQHFDVPGYRYSRKTEEKKP